MRVLQALVVAAFALAVDANGFFLKYALWVPTHSYLIVVRVGLWALLCAQAAREYYELIEVRVILLRLPHAVCVTHHQYSRGVACIAALMNMPVTLNDARRSNPVCAEPFAGCRSLPAS